MKKTIFTILLLGTALFASSNNSKDYSLQNALYIQECASCHMGFQSEFLPKRSWIKMMNTLENHFGVDASFDELDEKQIRNYLGSNASDSKNIYANMAKFARSISKDATPIAISEIPKFKKEHREISQNLISQKEVRTISNCIACHSDAKRGLYKERNIFIPNFGRWDD